MLQSVPVKLYTHYVRHCMCIIIIFMIKKVIFLFSTISTCR